MGAVERSFWHIFTGILVIFAVLLISGSVLIPGIEHVPQMSHQGGLPQVKAVASAEARPCQRFQKNRFQRPCARVVAPVI